MKPKSITKRYTIGQFPPAKISSGFENMIEIRAAAAFFIDFIIYVWVNLNNKLNPNKYIALYTDKIMYFFFICERTDHYEL